VQNVPRAQNDRSADMIFISSFKSEKAEQSSACAFVASTHFLSVAF